MKLGAVSAFSGLVGLPGGLVVGFPVSSGGGRGKGVKLGTAGEDQSKGNGVLSLFLLFALCFGGIRKACWFSLPVFLSFFFFWLKMRFIFDSWIFALNSDLIEP